MKIVLVRPPFVGSKFGPPIGLAYLSQALKNEGHEVSVYDINIEIEKAVSKPMAGYDRDFVLPGSHPALEFAQERMKEYSRKILSYQPDIVGFHLSYPTAAFGSELAKEVSRHIKCIAGGPYTTHNQRNLSDLGYYDAVVVGYGEEAVLEAINGGGIIEKPLHRSKEYRPDYTDMPLKDYQGILPVVTTRGCPNNCNFCTQNYPYFFHSIDSVVRQFKEVKDIRKVMYNDSNINVNPRRTEELFNELAKMEKKPFGHIFGMQINKGYERYIPGMAAAGVREVRLGIESGSLRERRSMNKAEFSNAEALNFIKLLTDHKILAISQFIFCFPGQLEEDREETIEFIHEINRRCDTRYVKHVFNKFVVHHGTEAYFKDKFGVDSTSPQYWRNSLYTPEKIKKIEKNFSTLLPENCKIYL